MEAIEKRFGGNTETKKVQKTLLKQQYKNFTGSNSESLDQIHDRLQKLASQIHTLIWRNKVDSEEQSLNDLFNSLKIYEAEVKSSSSTGTATQNLAFVSSSNTNSTTESVSAAASVSAKMHVSSLPNVDSLSNAVIYSFFACQSSSPELDNVDLKHIDVDDLEEMDLRWQMAMNGHFARECRSPKDSRRNEVAEPQRRTVPFETYTSNALVSQCDGLESIEARLLVYKQNEYVFEENIKLLNIKVQLRDNVLVTLRQKLEKAEQERDDLKLKLKKFQTSSKNISELLASQTNEKTCLGYNSQVFTRAMFDCDDYLSSESDESWPPSSLYDRFQPCDSLTKPEQDFSHTNKPTTPIIEDWVSNSEDESETKAPPFVPSFVQPIEQVKSPRHSIQHGETSIPAVTPKPASPKPASSGKRRNRKACFVCKSLDHLIKDCDYHAKKMAQPITRIHAHRGNHKQYAQMTHHNPYKHMVPAAVLTQSKPVSITAVRPVSAAVLQIKVTRSKQVQKIITKPKSPIRRNLTSSPSPKTSNLPLRVTVVKALVVSGAHGLQGKWEWRPKYPILDHVSRTTTASMILKRFDYNDALGRSKSDTGVIDSGCSRHMTGNMSYLSNFEELNGGYVAFGGDNDDNKSSNDDDNDNDVKKDEEDKEEEERLAPADPSDVSTDDLETMTTVNQGMSVEEIERVVAQRVANAIEAIAIYETKTNLAHKSMSQTERQEENVAENASNKRKWESNHYGSLSQQNKGHKKPRAHTAWPINKKAYAESLPLCNQCKSHHSGPCTVKYRNCKKVSHIIQNCRTPATAKNQQTRTCYECGSLRQYKSECPIVKFHKRVDMIHGRVRA
uniref:CCHC-type domain-containing protein n=1 Tax=Tanacetum cinerariifolium TaxID=118510 RepID=A0A6L2L6S7_TANCI|nr:hypothetical protein [Tanacetum cinerariifolium]